MSEIRRWDATHFNVSLRHFCSRSTSFPSTLEVFHDYALYKFTIDIDIDIAGCQLQRLQSVQNAAETLVTGFAENGEHYADPEVSALVTDSATGDLQAGNSGAQMH